MKENIVLILNPDEKVWLEKYREALDEQYPDLVQDIIVFGSKARGEAQEDSDLDVMIIIRGGNKKTKKDIAFLGYDLSCGTQAVPSIIVYTDEEKNYRIQHQSSFMEVVQEEGVSVR